MTKFRCIAIRTLEVMLDAVLACLLSYLIYYNCRWIAKLNYFKFIAYTPLYCGMMLVAGLGIYLSSHMHRKYASVTASVMLFIFALYFRMLVVSLVQENGIEMINDYRSSYIQTLQLISGEHKQIPNPLENGLHFTLTTYWGYHAALTSIIFKIIHPSLYSAAVIHAFIDAGSAVLLFLISLRLLRIFWIAISVGVLYAVYPAVVIYTNMYTGELYASFFLLLGILLVSIIFECRNSDRSKYCMPSRQQILAAVGSGMAWAVSDVFKPLIIVMYIAFMISLLWSWVRKKDILDWETVRRHMQYMMAFSILLIVYFSCGKIIATMYERYTNVTIKSEPSYPLILHGLRFATGKNRQSESESRDKEVAELRELYSNAAADEIKFINSDARKRILELLYDNFDKIPDMLMSRIQLLGNNTTWAIGWVLDGVRRVSKNKDQDYQFITDLNDGISFVHCIIVLSLGTIACVAGIFHRDFRGIAGFFINISFLGATMVLLITAPQTRYKITMFMPLLFLQTGYGLCFFDSQLTRIRKILQNDN